MDGERSRAWAYLLVAIAGFIAGMAVGRLGAEGGRGLRGAERPARALPHPRALQP